MYVLSASVDQFLPRDTVESAVFAVARRMSVRPVRVLYPDG